MGWIGRVGEWFLQREQLAEARKRLKETPAGHKTCLRRATACLSLADSLHDPLEPSESLCPEIVGIYRLACAWLLSAAASTPRPIADLLQEADQATLLTAAGGRAAFDAVRTVLLRNAFEEADLDRQQLVAEARSLKTFAHSAQRLIDPHYAIRAVWLRRLARLAIVVAPSLVLIGVVVAAEWKSPAQSLPKDPNRLAGVVWQASSSYCNLRHHECWGQPSDLFFHTNEEDSPWVEFDLEQATPISRVEVKNIKDVALQGRAVPLIVEVSSDRSNWTDVAQRHTSFDTWTAEFPSTVVRYVRLRVIRRTYFHLENVSIR